jgi:diaminopimelate decarboxylase
MLNDGEHISVNEDNHLILHGVDLVGLCEKYGTPLFVFDEAKLVQNFKRFKQAFESIYPKVMVCYSVKTNNNLAICKVLKKEGAHAEVSSGLDLHIALKAGFRGEEIIFDGPFKPKETLKKAIEADVSIINIESFFEMERLNDVAREVGVKQSIGIRINPYKEPGFSKYFSLISLIDSAYCNLDSRFGFALEEAYEAFRKALKFKNLTVEGVMTHPYRSAVEILLPLMHELHKKLKVEIKYLNIGGGFNPGNVRFVGSKELIFDFLRRRIGLKSKLSEEIRVPRIESVAKSIVSKIRQKLGELPEPILVVEPGRFIVSSAGLLLVRVDHVKKAGGYKWVIVDGGTNLIPPFSVAEFRKVMITNRAHNEPREEINIVGPLLYSNDFITLKASLPKVREGDILSIFGCGAYSLSRSNQFLYPRPAAVLLGADGKVKVIRERENYEDVWLKDKEV